MPAPRNRRFIYLWISSVLLFVALGTVSLSLDIYRWFPAFGFMGYSAVLVLLLSAMANAWGKWHYIAVSITLILFGTIASLDIVMSKEAIVADLAVIEMSGLQRLLADPAMIDDYVNILVILLNIFTSSVAGNALFYGLNTRNFVAKEHGSRMRVVDE
ncbi:hypothetical protein [Kistimonas asteriae]|uniref:hypothetical protein n=1 Tax=Kistimonas asteriae TaxID=517724 RepID=UPI001BA4D987|nr:hypothetical protein [Kistimonas asteriae]